MTTETRPTLAVWKFASCDGCQLQLLSAGILALADRFRIAWFPEATRGTLAGPYDLSLVEGSITTPADLDRIRGIRAASRTLVTIGACATAGGIQALRNYGDVREWTAQIYARPEYIETLSTSTAIADHVPVDLELRGCPIEVDQLTDVVAAHLAGRPPAIPTHSVCVECKLRGTPCVLVTADTPCLGPITQAGCGARCPAYDRGCYGCFGPMESTQAEPLTTRLRDHLGVDRPDLLRMLRTFNAAAPAFELAADQLAEPEHASEAT